MSSARAGRRSRIAVIGFLAASVALLMVGGAGPAYRVKLVDLGDAFALLRWGAWAGLAAFFVAFIGGWITRPGTQRRGFALTLAGMVIGAAAFCVPFAMLQNAKRTPPIHDITTDTANPPRFVAIIPLRKDSPNPIEYQGESISRQQRAAYPDVEPATLVEPADTTFKRALKAARDLGWQIVAAVPNEGGGSKQPIRQPGLDSRTTSSFASLPPMPGAASTCARFRALEKAISVKMPRAFEHT